MTFCDLEKNKKTFNYVKQYIKNIGTDFTKLDTSIQLEEIKNHIKSNPNKDENKEILKWIDENSKKFRIYLNTVKIVFTVWYCSSQNDDIEWKEFCNIVDKLEEIKSTCLDTIMIEGKYIY